ncbi:hypothetical protein PIB30_022734 [Stylosanthes scabra]|uniref:Uncharacterized protein n=1 Tax=Stylosanthes scabra TaxID=79078 RepID=A0ABU6Z9I8_9FABA|nr:hypothetical protein [Stylosanthes scabra]
MARPLVGPEASQRSWSLLPIVRWSPENGAYLAIVRWVHDKTHSDGQSSKWKRLERAKMNEMIATKPRRLKLDQMRTQQKSHTYASRRGEHAQKADPAQMCTHMKLSCDRMGRNEVKSVTAIRTPLLAKGEVPATRIHHGDHRVRSATNQWVGSQTPLPYLHRLRVHSSNADLLESIVGSVPHSWYAKNMQRFLLGDSSSDLGHSRDYRDAQDKGFQLQRRKFLPRADVSIHRQSSDVEHSGLGLPSPNFSQNDSISTQVSVWRVSRVRKRHGIFVKQFLYFEANNGVVVLDLEHWNAGNMKSDGKRTSPTMSVDAKDGSEKSL